jgi:hypothetical protein
VGLWCIFSSAMSTGVVWGKRWANLWRWELTGEVGRCGGDDSTWRGSGSSRRHRSGKLWWPVVGPIAQGGREA